MRQTRANGETADDTPTERIRRLGSELAPSLRRVASAVTADLAQSAYLSGPALSKKTGVSQATVVRFAQALGYSGYPDFLDALRREVSARPTVEKLRQAGHEKQPVWRSVMNADLENLSRTIAELDSRQFDLAVAKMKSARRIYVWGVRSTAVVSELLVHALTYLLGADRAVRLQPTLYHEQLLSAGPADVVIVASFPRYLRLSVNVAHRALEQRVFTIALTDSLLSPLVPLADCVLCARSELLSFTESFTAVISLTNALLTAVAVSDRKKALAHLRQLERVWEVEGVYQERNKRKQGAPLGI